MFSNPSDIRPKVFLGYTKKANQLVTAISENFKEEDFLIKLSPFDLLDLSTQASEQIYHEIKSCDFAMLVFDSNWGQNLNGRTIEYAQYVAFRTGICVASLGSERVFYAIPAEFEDPFFSSLPSETSTLYKENGTDLKQNLKMFSNMVLKNISKLGSVEKPTFIPDNHEFTDLKTHYCLHVLNKGGDAYIERRMTLLANQDGVNARHHKIFSHESPSTFENCKIEAWDDSRKKMFVEKLYDMPRTKEFRVNFRHSLTKGDKLNYSYKFFWANFFPFKSKNSDFSLKSTAKEILIDLIIPSSWDLMYIKADGRRFDGSSKLDPIILKEKGKKIEREFSRFQYELKGFEKHTMEIRLSWVWG